MQPLKYILISYMYVNNMDIGLIKFHSISLISNTANIAKCNSPLHMRISIIKTKLTYFCCMYGERMFTCCSPNYTMLPLLCLAVCFSMVSCDEHTRPLAEITDLRRLFHSHARIVGGHDTTTEQNPWQAHLYNNSKFVCGASLIKMGKRQNEQTDLVLTAAHCVQRANASNLTIRVGTDKMFEGTPIPVLKVVQHEKYNHSAASRYPNDIAMIKLTSPVKYTTRISGIKLPPKNSKEPLNPRYCKATGYGTFTEAGNSLRTLSEVQLPYLPKDVCLKAYNYSQIDKGLAFCAGFEAGGKDACQGDSGGPYVCYQNGEMFQYGIVSWGYGCARGTTPGVYTNVVKYKQWIRKTIHQMR